MTNNGSDADSNPTPPNELKFSDGPEISAKGELIPSVAEVEYLNQRRKAAKKYLNSTAASGLSEVKSGKSDGAKESEITEESQKVLKTFPAEIDSREFPEETWGLALSGGGIRSASFNLGFVQALLEKKIFHRFDYLSTVSGGGYLGAFLGAIVSEKEIAEKFDAQILEEEIVPERSGKQKPRVIRLLKTGRYLKKVPAFLNRYFFGLVALNLWLFCGLACLGAITAWGFRLVTNNPLMIDVITSLGFVGDIPRSFVPAFFIAILWLLSWFARNLWLWNLQVLHEKKVSELGEHEKGVQETPTWNSLNRVLCITWLGLIVLGFLSLLVTGDLSLGDSDKQTTKEFLTHLGQFLGVVLIVLQILTVLPIFRLDEVVKSGANPDKTSHSWLFNFVGPGIIFGLPLLSFSYFVQEDLSEVVADSTTETVGGQTGKIESIEHGPIAEHEPQAAGGEEAYALKTDFRNQRLLSRSHIKNWRKFWEKVLSNRRQNSVLGESEEGLGRAKWVREIQSENIDRALIRAIGSYQFSEKAISSLNKQWNEKIEKLLTQEKFDRGVLIIEASILLRDNMVEITNVTDPIISLPQAPEHYRLRREFRLVSEEMIDAINHLVLSDPNTFLLFESSRPLVSLEFDENPETPGQVQELSFQESKPLAKFTALAKSQISLQGTIPEQEFLKQTRQVNRDLFQAYFGASLLHPPGTIFSSTTYYADQYRRLKWFLIFGAFFVLIGVVADINNISLHAFYRARLHDMWLKNSTDHPDGQRKRAPPRKLSELELDRKKEGARTFPYLLVNATGHLFRDGIPSVLGQDYSSLPKMARFEFNPDYCSYYYDDEIYDGPGDENNEKQEYINRQIFKEQTTSFEKQPHVDLAGIMAISGSAVSPAMTSNMILKLLLFLTNFRLSQWLRQPDKNLSNTEGRKKLLVRIWEKFRSHPGIGKCLLQAGFWRMKKQKFVLLTDGGHYENLGIEALLDRKIKKIVCVDAGYDPERTFADLLKLMRRSRVMKGIQIGVKDEDGVRFMNHDELSALQVSRLRYRWSQEHYLSLSIQYADDPEGKHLGELIYVKPSFIGDEPAELISYTDENPDFPHDPTLDQFYEERRFESYRALGEHIGARIIKETLLDDSEINEEDRGTKKAVKGKPVKEKALQIETAPVTNERNQVETDKHVFDDLHYQLADLKALFLGLDAGEELRVGSKKWNECVKKVFEILTDEGGIDTWGAMYTWDLITDIYTKNPTRGEELLYVAAKNETFKDIAEQFLKMIGELKNN